MLRILVALASVGIGLAAPTDSPSRGDLDAHLSHLDTKAENIVTESGKWDKTPGKDTVLVGSGHPTGDYSLAICSRGTDCYAQGKYSIVIGNSDSLGLEKANAKGDESVAIGHLMQARGYRSMALGVQAKADGPGSIAMGYLSRTKGTVSTAIGEHTVAASANEVTLGAYSEGCKRWARFAFECEEFDAYSTTEVDERDVALRVGIGKPVGDYGRCDFATDDTFLYCNRGRHDGLRLYKNGTLYLSKPGGTPMRDVQAAIEERATKAELATLATKADLATLATKKELDTYTAQLQILTTELQTATTQLQNTNAFLAGTVADVTIKLKASQDALTKALERIDALERKVGGGSTTPPSPPPLPPCVGRDGFNLGYGDCSTYAPSASNHKYCTADGALEECSECDKCQDAGTKNMKVTAMARDDVVQRRRGA